MKESAAIILLLKFGSLKDIFERKLTFIKHNLKYQSTLNKANFNIMRFITTFNVVVLSVLSFGYYRIVTFTDIFQRSFEVARATYKYFVYYGIMLWAEPTEQVWSWRQFEYLFNYLNAWFSISFCRVENILTTSIFQMLNTKIFRRV